MPQARINPKALIKKSHRNKSGGFPCINPKWANSIAIF